MLPFKLVYSEKYFLPIGEHVFRADKFRLIRERLLQQRAADETDSLTPEPAAESEGEDRLEAALRLGRPGPYQIQAAIAACHARAGTAQETNWFRIAALYEVLAETAPSPVVELNRAVALSMAFGPATGLELLDQLLDEPSLRNYHLLPSVRGDLLAKLGRTAEARAEFERAAGLARNDRERELLASRAEALSG